MSYLLDTPFYEGIFMMRKSRLFQVTLLIVLIAFSIVGCSGNQDPAASQNNQQSTASAAPTAGGQSQESDEGSPVPSAENSPKSDSLELNIKPLEITTPSNDPVIIPEIDIDAYAIPDTESMRFVKDMKIGWNLGNTFDATSESTSLADELKIETAWVGVETTGEMIQAVKEAGFNTIRIPVSWHNHLLENFTISEPWLNRVNEVVDYAMAEGMYVIINIHHDIDKNFYYPTSEFFENSLAYSNAIWTQLAKRFRDYDNHLIFESVNEPRMTGTKYEWWLDMNNESCRDAVDCINRLNQAFVDVVRASGGNNATRYLMVPGYDASADSALSSAFKLPTDTVADRMIVSVHAYTPYNFALQGPNEGGNVSTWSITSDASTRDIDAFMDGLYNKYISQGIPVVIGEFGSRDKNGNLQARVDHAAYYIRSARARGMTCVWWDNNAFSGSGENFGLLNRRKVEWQYPDLVASLMKYAEAQ